VGQTVVSSTVQSGTVDSDADVDVKSPNRVEGGSVAFNSMGTTPVLNAISGSGGKVRLKVTSGSGSPAIAANNIVLTFAGGRTPRKVYLATSVLTPGFYVASVGAGSVSIGSKLAPVASTAYELELIVLF
jgi:hypothetical protein